MGVNMWYQATKLFGREGSTRTVKKGRHSPGAKGFDGRGKGGGSVTSLLPIDEHGRFSLGEPMDFSTLGSALKSVACIFGCKEIDSQAIADEFLNRR